MVENSIIKPSVEIGFPGHKPTVSNYVIRRKANKSTPGIKEALQTC